MPKKRSKKANKKKLTKLTPEMAMAIGAGKHTGKRNLVKRGGKRGGKRGPHDMHRSTIAGDTTLKPATPTEIAKVAEGDYGVDKLLGDVKYKSKPKLTPKQRSGKLKPLPVLEYQFTKMAKLVEERAGRAPRKGEMPLKFLAARTVRLGQIVKKRGGY